MSKASEAYAAYRKSDCYKQCDGYCCECCGSDPKEQSACIAEAVAQERERCAKIAETHQCEECECCGAERDIAKKIRNGSDPGGELAPCVKAGDWRCADEAKP